MDFDDLDEETEKRIDAGEEVIGHVKENRQPRQGDELPLITRSNLLPGFDKLPDAVKKQVPPWNGETPVTKNPVLRLLCVHGVADSYQQDWFRLELDAPPDVEVAMHEFPGHGHRDKEPILGSVAELADDCFEAFRDSMDTGSFALLGHSIGCLIITEVAKRARAELGVEPVMVFMVERGACPHPLFTESGYAKLRDDPASLMAVHQPNVLAFYKSAGEIGQRTMDMWQRGWFCENNCFEVGYHTFNCPLLAMFAEYMVRRETTYEDLDDYGKLVISEGSKTFNTKREDGTCFVGHFPEWTFHDWADWTEFKDSFKVVECMGCDHMTIKASRWFKAPVFNALRDIIKKWASTA